MRRPAPYIFLYTPYVILRSRVRSRVDWTELTIGGSVMLIDMKNVIILVVVALASMLGSVPM